MEITQEQKQQLLGYIGLAKRGGFLILGMETILSTWNAQIPSVVLFSQDISEKSKKNMVYFCQQNHLTYLDIPLSKEEVWGLVGKGAGVLLIQNKGLAEKLIGFHNG